MLKKIICRISEQIKGTQARGCSPRHLHEQRIFSNAAKCAACARREPDSEPCQNNQCLGIASPEIPGKAFSKEVNYSSVMMSHAILSFPSNPVILRFNLCSVPTCSHHTICSILSPATTTTSTTSTTTFEIFGEHVAVREHHHDCFLMHSSQRILIYMFCQIMTLSRDITPSRGA